MLKKGRKKLTSWGCSVQSISVSRTRIRLSSAVGFCAATSVEKCENGRKFRRVVRFSTEITVGIALGKVLGDPTERTARGKKDLEALRSTELKAISRLLLDLGRWKMVVCFLYRVFWGYCGVAESLLDVCL